MSRINEVRIVARFDRITGEDALQLLLHSLHTCVYVENMEIATCVRAQRSFSQLHFGAPTWRPRTEVSENETEMYGGASG